MLTATKINDKIKNQNHHQKTGDGGDGADLYHDQTRWSATRHRWADHLSVTITTITTKVTKITTITAKVTKKQQKQPTPQNEKQ